MLFLLLALLDRGLTLDPVEYVDQVEVNTWGENGLTQVILWKWEESEQNFVVIGWSIYNDRNKDEMDIFHDGRYTTLRLRGIKIKCPNRVKYTKTELDPEILDKRKYGQTYRDPRLNIGGFHYEQG